ncbi:PHP domain-containing protein [Candidatus Berkelbacteria bacterium]|nr:PHP domain-containing protein [Candidatus Berkelbacteria bacterium]
MFPVDLHSHSHYSPDGHLPVEELFKRAKKLGVKVLAVTDHNTTKQFDDARTAAKTVEIETVEGIEVTAAWDGVPVHILGYANHFDRSVLGEGLRATIEGYNRLAQEKLKKLVQLGLPRLSFNELLTMTTGEYVANHQIATALAQRLHSSYQYAYSYVKQGGAADFSYGKWALSPKQAVALVRRAGGVAILAHPGWSQKQIKDAKRTIVQLIDELRNDIVGVEVNHIENTADGMPQLKRHVKNRGLLLTGGSDWHGTQFTGFYQLGDWGCAYRTFLKLKEKLARG